MSKHRTKTLLTQYENYIRANAPKKTIKQMAEHLGESFSYVRQFMINKGIPYRFRATRTRLSFKDRIPEVIKPNKPNPTSFTRPPATYDNRSQQDVIDHYLKLEI